MMAQSLEDANHRPVGSREPQGRGEGIDYVTCMLCRRQFKVIVNKHLVKIHGFDARRPLAQYRKAYPSSRIWCLRTRRTLSAALVRFARRQPKAWTKPQVVEKIRQLRERGMALGIRSVAGIYPRLLRGAVRHFGSWPRALESCGVDPTRVRQHRRWTPERVLRAMRSRRRQGQSLAYRVVHLEDTGLAKAAERGFGSWDQALRAAGLNPRLMRGNEAWDPDQVLARIREAVRNTPPAELRLRDKRLVAIASLYFRGWRTALEVAGVVPRSKVQPPRLSRQEVVAQMRGHVRGGGSLAWKQLFREKPWLIVGALEAFGTWRTAVSKAGYQVSRSTTRQEWTRPELLTLLRRLYRMHGEVTPALLRRARPQGYASPGQHVLLLFGSLKNAVREIALTNGHKPQSGESIGDVGSGRTHG